MSHIPLSTANKNSINIQRYNPTKFDYTRITLTTNQGPSNILEDHKWRDLQGDYSQWRPRVRVDKLASNEALIVFRRVHYPDLRHVLESIGYLSQKNHGTEDVFILDRNSYPFQDGITDRVSSLQDLPLHSLESVIVHIPYGLRIGRFHKDDPTNPELQYGLSGIETITRAAGAYVPPTIKFGVPDNVKLQAMVTLDSPESKHINHHGDYDSFLNLPAMISGKPYDPTQHGGSISREGRADLHWTHVVVLRFSEDVK